MQKNKRNIHLKKNRFKKKEKNEKKQKKKEFKKRYSPNNFCSFKTYICKIMIVK